MYRMVLTFVILLMLIFLPSCGGSADSTSADVQAQQALQKIIADVSVDDTVTGINQFGLALYAQLRPQSGNLFFSPYSIATALAMTYGGARGETATAMEAVLHLVTQAPYPHAAYAALSQQFSRGPNELNLANRLWVQKGEALLADFLTLTRTFYGAPCAQVDFVGQTERARLAINDWAAENTRQKIRNLIRPGVLSPDTALVLANAIYFKGQWAERFDVRDTRDAPFTLLDGSQVKVPMMFQSGKFKYAFHPEVNMVALPYKGKALSMVVLVPAAKDGLKNLEKKLSVQNLKQWMGALRQGKVNVCLPKLKTESEFALSQVLKNMGMAEAFSGRADFSGINGKGGLFIGNVIHKAFVEVNEAGTEAAAATAVVMEKSEMPPTVRADRPFLFLIRHNATGAVLFMGRIVRP